MNNSMKNIFQIIMRTLHSDKSNLLPSLYGRGMGVGLLVLLLTSCEKEIDMDYHTIEPLYVVEAGISEAGAVARISQTQNVTDEISNRPVDNAQIQIISDNSSDKSAEYMREIRYVVTEEYAVIYLFTQENQSNQNNRHRYFPGSYICKGDQ